MKRRTAKHRRPTFESLERRRVLAASLGWDGPGLGSADLTYTIKGSPEGLSQAETNAAIETAFAAWSGAADVTFTPTSTIGLHDSIDISFVSLDGTAGTLAQAYFPDDVNPDRIAGDIQFDIAESWEVGNELGNQAFDLVWVAVHEIGHALGLDHSDEDESVLAESVSPNQFFTTLSSDDTVAILEIYAAAGSTDEGETDNTNVETSINETEVETDNTDESAFPRSRWRRGGPWHRFGGRLDAERIQFNYLSPTDVNGDSATSVLDALLVINQLQRFSTNQLSDLSEVETVGLCDVNGDGTITVADALNVINSLIVSDDPETVDEAADQTEESEETDSQENATEESVDETDEPIDDGGLVDDTPDTETEEETDEEIDEENTEENSEDEHAEDCSNRRTRRPFGRSQINLFGGDAAAFIDHFDSDDDDALVEGEVTPRLWEKLNDLEVDADADGTVTVEELEAAIETARRDAFDVLDTDGDELLTETEIGERLWLKVSPADADSDQAVSFEEFNELIADGESPLRDTVDHSPRRHLHRHPSDAVFAMLGRRRHRS